MKKTKILCTIGPASQDESVLRRMHSAGMNAVRINTSHGDFQQYARILSSVRSIGNLPVLLDTKGPEVRVRCAREHILARGSTIEIGFSDRHPIYFDYDFRTKVRKDSLLLINDGLLQLKVLGQRNGALRLKVLNSEKIHSGKRVNLPGVHLGLPILSEKDVESLEFAKKNNIEYLALSFAGSARDIREVRRRLGKSSIKIIAKIENRRGVMNFDSILSEVDGIMIARGDLGLEIPSEKLPILQKQFIRECNQKGKIVITATQMLRSMVSSPVPTRAETSDVGNAILDGTDAVMLSEESAIGEYPVESVKVMSRIASEVEPYVKNSICCPNTSRVSDAISKSIFELASTLPIKRIVTITRSGYTACMISRFRLSQGIIAVTGNPVVERQMMLNYGVTPVLYPDIPESKAVPSVALYLHRKGLLKRDELVLFTSGSHSRVHSTNMIQVNRVSEFLP